MKTLPKPRTYEDENVNFYHDGKNNGFLGDFVRTTHLENLGRQYVGRIYDAHFSCPEGDDWLAMQLHLGPDPMIWKKCRWVSILVHQGGAIVVPEQVVEVIEPFELDNNNKRMYFGDW